MNSKLCDISSRKRRTFKGMVIYIYASELHSIPFYFYKKLDAQSNKEYSDLFVMLQ
jgi:hypothetical protein